MDELANERYNHIPTPVMTVGPGTVRYDQKIHNDRTFPTNKPDIILRHENRCELTEISVPAEIKTKG